MRAVIQRVKSAALSVDGAVVAEIGRGLVAYVGIEQNDAEGDVVRLCQKIAAMRIFQDGDGKMNLSVADVDGDVLLVPNFTLCADISHGNRPSFTAAMRPFTAASELFSYCADVMRDVMRSAACSGRAERGVFGADMTIEQANDGPVTLIY